MEGTIFLCGKNTPPQLSRLNQDDFVFDLQRFVADNQWNKDTTIDGTAIGENEIAGYDTQQDSTKIKVENGSTTKFFKYMQSAMNFVVGNAVTPTGGASNNTYGNYSASGATITLLDDITDGEAFTLARTRDGKAYDTKVVIDLDNHKYLFKSLLSGDNASGVSKDKAIATTYNENTSATIKGGTMGVAENNTAKFDRFMKSYIDLTLEDFTLDGSGFDYSGIEKGFDGALICVSAGDVNLTGNTKITGVADGFYALGGKLATKGGYSGGFSIAVNTSGEIDNIAMYDWHTDDFWATDGDFSKGKLNIQKGIVGSVEYSERAVKTGAMANTTISANASIGSVNGVNDYLAYSEIGATNSIYDNRSDSINGGILYAAGQVGWNDGSTEN